MLSNIVIGIITGIFTGVVTGLFVTNLYRKVDKEAEAYEFWREYLFRALDEGGVHLSTDYVDYSSYIKDNEKLVHDISRIIELRGEEMLRNNLTEKEHELTDCAIDAIYELEKCRKRKENDWKKLLVDN